MYRPAGPAPENTLFTPAAGARLRLTGTLSLPRPSHVATAHRTNAGNPVPVSTPAKILRRFA